jgi:hypothetical protein
MVISRLCSCLYSATYRLCVSCLQCLSWSALNCYDHIRWGRLCSQALKSNIFEVCILEGLCVVDCSVGIELDFDDVTIFRLCSYLQARRQRRLVCPTCVPSRNIPSNDTCWVLNHSVALWLNLMVLVTWKV